MQYSFHSIAGLTKFLRVLLVIGAVWSLVMTLSSWLQLELLSQDDFSPSEGESNDLREAVVGVVYLIIFITTVIVFSRWIYCANRNARALGASDMRFTPGWAVGYFFVPVVSLWCPYQAMKDLWRASVDAKGWQGVLPGPILGVWWTLWVVDGFLGQASLRASMAAKDIEGLKLSSVVDLVSNIVDFPLFIVALVLISQIYRSQTGQTPSDTVLEPALA